MGRIDAETLYVGILFALVALIGWGGFVDGYLYFTGQTTVTDFLRVNPRWFFTPLVAVLSFLALLTTHLYLTGN